MRTKTEYITKIKCIFNRVVSTINEKFMTDDVKNFYLNTPNGLSRIHDNTSQTQTTINHQLIQLTTTSKERLYISWNNQRNAWNNTDRATCKWITFKTTCKIWPPPSPKTYPGTTEPQNMPNQIFSSCWILLHWVNKHGRRRIPDKRAQIKIWAGI